MMAAHGQHQGQQASIRLLALYETTGYTEGFEISYRGITLTKTDSETWTATDNHGTLADIPKDEFSKRAWVDHINGIAKHREQYLALTEDDQ